jgi:uncharacterized LabA/DUF88 family protein
MPLNNPASLEKVRYLFVDGGSLDSLLASFSKGLFGERQVEIDYSKLGDGYHKVFYYDCLPAQKHNEAESDYQQRLALKTKLFNQLKELDKFHVYEGTARFRDRNKGQEQKQVDIMIAVDMLSHSFRRNMQEATLLTGDLDFKPLIDALVQDGMYVSLWYPKGKANYELIDAADSKIPLTINFVQDWFTKNFQKNAQLPKLIQPNPISKINSMPFDPPFWSFLNELESGSYKASFYQHQYDGFAAVVQSDQNPSNLYTHPNLEQLKFYVNHLHSANIFRG